MPTPASEPLAAVYRRMGQRLFRYASAILASAEDAEDVVQDLFVALAETSPWPRDVDGYLLRAARNRSLKRLGRSRRRLQLLKEGMPMLLPRDPGDPALTELARKASLALAELPVEQREAVALHLFDGMTFEAIGELTEAPASTAASRYQAGIGKLQERLAR